jgi:phage/plasmid-associated DNA primase
MKQEAQAEAIAILNDAESLASKRYGIKTGSVIEDQYFNAPTHKAGAAVLASSFGGRVIYEKETGRFWERTPGGWYDPLDDMLSRASSIIDAAAVRAFQGIVDTLQAQQLQGAYLKAATARKRAQTKEFIASALAFFAEATHVPGLATKWNAIPETLPTTTGILDFSGDEPTIRAPRENEYFRDPLPYAAEDVLKLNIPAAFMLALAEYFPDPEIRKTAIDCIALAVGNRGSRTFQLWHGEAGANGKNTLLDAIREVLPGRVGTIGGSAITRGPDGGAKRFGAAELEGKLLAAIDEVSGSFDVPEVKRLTGASTITIERKGRDSYEIPQRWALVALTNRLPSFSPATDSAFLQRLIIVPFDTVFFFNEIQKEEYCRLGIDEARLKPAQSKEDLLASIRRERPAILKYLIDTYMKMRAAGGRPYECGKSLQLKQSYASANDLVAQFFLEHFHRNPAGRVEYARILELWREYTGDKSASTREVTKKMIDRFPWIEKAVSNSKRHLIGLSEGEPPSNDSPHKKEENDKEKQHPRNTEEEGQYTSTEKGFFILKKDFCQKASSDIENTLLRTSVLEPQEEFYFEAASKVYDLLRSSIDSQTENLKKAGLSGSSARVLLTDLKEQALKQGMNETSFQGACRTLSESGLVAYEAPYIGLGEGIPQGARNE